MTARKDRKLAWRDEYDARSQGAGDEMGDLHSAAVTGMVIRYSLINMLEIEIGETRNRWQRNARNAVRGTEDDQEAQWQRKDSSAISREQKREERIEK